MLIIGTHTRFEYQSIKTDKLSINYPLIQNLFFLVFILQILYKFNLTHIYFKKDFVISDISNLDFG